MVNRIVLAAFAAVAIVVLVSPAVGGRQVRSPAMRVGVRQTLPSFATCLHDAASLPDNRTRREQAHALARAINQAQGRAVAASERYQPLAKLPGLPPAPGGFELRFYTDGAGYILSLKDTLDPCRYGVFTDQHGRVYEMSPQVPQIAN